MFPYWHGRYACIYGFYNTDTFIPYRKPLTFTSPLIFNLKKTGTRVLNSIDMSPLIISFPFSLKILIYLTKKLSFRFVSPKKFVSLRSLRTSQNNELNPSKEKKMHIDAMSCDWAKKQNRPFTKVRSSLKGLLIVT